MNTQIYSKDNFMEMDPMHDAYASKIQLENNILTITYNDIDILNTDGTPYYKYKRLIVKYEFDSFCNAKLYYGKNKYKIINLHEQIDRFYILTNGCIFTSYKYSVDCFEEIALDFFIEKRRKDRWLRTKYQRVEISLDATKVTYNWM